MRMSVVTHHPKLFMFTSLALTVCAMVIMTVVLTLLAVVPAYSTTTVRAVAPTISETPAFVEFRAAVVADDSVGGAFEEAAHVPGVWSPASNGAVDHDPESGAGMTGNLWMAER